MIAKIPRPPEVLAVEDPENESLKWAGRLSSIYGREAASIDLKPKGVYYRVGFKAMVERLQTTFEGGFKSRMQM